MAARVAIYGLGRISPSALTDRAFDAVGIVSVTVAQKTADAEADDTSCQAARGRYWDSLGVIGQARVSSGTAAVVRACAVELALATVAYDDLRAVMIGYDNERGGARQTVRQTPAMPSEAASLR